MPDLVEIGTWVGWLLLFGWLAAIAFRISTGDIRTHGLIQGRTSRGARFLSGGRVQLLLVTLSCAAQYLYQLWQNPQRFPAISTPWVVLFGGSHVLYLGAKFHGKRSGRFDI